jgi:hypothetical protein
MPAIDSEVIKRRALVLLERVARIREEGEGRIAMLELLEIAGLTLDARLQERIVARGDVLLVYTEPEAGTFSNSGGAFSVPVGPLKLQVPTDLGGKLTDRDGIFILHFDTNRTMFGKVIFMEVRLKALEVSPHHVAVRFPGGALDQEIRF